MSNLVIRSRHNLNHKKKSGKSYRNLSRRQIGSSSEIKRYYNIYFNYIYYVNPDDLNDLNVNILTRQITPSELGDAWDHFTECRSIEMDDNPQLIDIILVGLTQLEQPRNIKHFNLEIYTVNKSHEESLGLIHDLMVLASNDPIDFTRYGSSRDSNHYKVNYDDSDEENDVDIVEAVIRRGFPELGKRFYVYFNYIVKNWITGSDRTINGTFLTRRLTVEESDYLSQDTYDKIHDITIDHAPQLKNLSLKNFVQLEAPHNDKHFRLELLIVNLGDQESIVLIEYLMRELYDYISFDTHISNDTNQYKMIAESYDIEPIVSAIDGGVLNKYNRRSIRHLRNI